MSRVRFSPPVPNQQHRVLIRQCLVLFLWVKKSRHTGNPANKHLHQLDKTHIEIDGHTKSAAYFEGGNAMHNHGQLWLVRATGQYAYDAAKSRVCIVMQTRDGCVVIRLC